ncbi:MAG: ABC transporter permease [Planctomycetota bacterium]|jgi:ribose transport system permease protein|nr:ABC transporter permease [Planctomycetota bacterium]
MSSQPPMTRKRKNPVWEYLGHNAGILIGLLAMCAVIIVYQPNFLNSKNLLNIMRSISMTGILGFGMTMCIIINGIDLSQGSVIGLSSCFCAWVITNAGAPFWLAILLSLCIGALCGFINGALLANTPMPPFIVTLAMMLIARGGCYVITRGNMINVDSSFGFLGNGYLFGVIPNPVIILLVLFVIMSLLLGKSKFGRNVYAIGGNIEAARFSGINIRNATWIIYTISGTLAGICGVISCSRITTGQPTTGNAMEFDAVAACYLGGISYLGGEGRQGSTLIGAIVLGVLANGMSMLQIPWYVQNITKGLIILLAVFFDVMRRNRAARKI